MVFSSLGTVIGPHKSLVSQQKKIRSKLEHFSNLYPYNIYIYILFYIFFTISLFIVIRLHIFRGLYHALVFFFQATLEPKVIGFDSHNNKIKSVKIFFINSHKIIKSPFYNR